MSRRKLVDVIEFVITVEGELLGRWKNIAKYHQANLDSERLDYSDKENHCKTKKKYTKIQFDTIKKKCYCHNYYNEGHFTKECKLLNKFYQILKSNEHNTNQVIQ